MKLSRSYNPVLILLFIVYSILIALAWVYLRNSDQFETQKLKVSDFVGAAIAAASVFIGTVATVLSFRSLRFAKDANEGQVYLEMMRRYSSKEMVDSLQKLGKFRDDSNGDIEKACKIWYQDYLSGDPEAALINEARHRIKYFYRDLMQMYQANYFSKALTKRLLNPGGRHLFHNVVLPMDKALNNLLFEGEYAPFDTFYQELNNEQKISSSPQKVLRKVCLIPARYDASRFPGKLLSLLEKAPGEYKTVIRATYENISAMGIFDYVAVVTNSEIIQREIENHNGNVVYLDKAYESGTDRIADAASFMDADIIINVQGDEPFVTREPLEDILAAFKNNFDELQVISLMRPMDNPADIVNSDFVKVVCDNNDNALYFSRSIVPFIKRKENEIPYYEHIGVYGFTRKALLKFPTLSPTKLEKVESVECLRYLENGIPLKMIQTSVHILEIDTEADLENANRLLKEGKLHLV